MIHAVHFQCSVTHKIEPFGRDVAPALKDTMGFLCMLMRSKVMYQGQGSSEVKLSGKCEIGIIFFFFLKS